MSHEISLITATEMLDTYRLEKFPAIAETNDPRHTNRPLTYKATTTANVTTQTLAYGKNKIGALLETYARCSWSSAIAHLTYRPRRKELSTTTKILKQFANEYLPYQPDTELDTVIMAANFLRSEIMTSARNAWPTLGDLIEDYPIRITTEPVAIVEYKQHKAARATNEEN